MLSTAPHTRPAVIGGAYPEMEAAAIEVGDQLTDDESDTNSDAGSEEREGSGVGEPTVDQKLKRDAILAAASQYNDVNGWDLIGGVPSMIKLSATGPVTIVPYDRTKPLKADYRQQQDEYNLPNSRNGGEWYHRALDQFPVAPYGKVFVNFYSIDIQTCGVKLPPNKHIPGCLGDVYLVAHFEAAEDGMEWGRNVSYDDFDKTEELPDYLKWDWQNTHGIMPSCSAPGVWRSMVGELRFKSLYYYNKFNEASTQMANATLRKVQDVAPQFYRECQRDFLRYNKAFTHPEAELAHTSGSFMHPNGIDVQLLRSFEALEAYSDGLVDISNDYLERADADYGFEGRLLKHMFEGFQIDCAGVHSNDYATNISKVWEALYKRTLAQAAESAAGRARRLEIHDAMMAAQEAEAKAKEQRRKLAAAESRAAKANAPEAPYTARGAHRLSQRAGKKAGREQRRQSDREAATAAALEHEVHVLPEQKGYRSEAAELRKEVAHSERLAREAKEKLDTLRELAKNASAAHEAATHNVPAALSIGNSLAAAMDKVG